MKHLLALASTLLIAISIHGQNEALSSEDLEFQQYIEHDSIIGQTGSVVLDEAHCTLQVPDGFVFLNPEETKHLLVDYWENPSEKLSGTLGAMVRQNAGTYINVETAYVIWYEDAGYVSDEDAKGIDYAELLKEMQDETLEENKTNTQGIKWELIDWAWPPTYDNNDKVLAWAKLFCVNDTNMILNYDVRILGKKGFVMIKAVSSPDFKDEIQADNSAITGSIRYNDGYRYSDFNPATDKIAPLTIGGLIAGKILTKASIWAVIAKFSKLIIIAIIGFIAAMRKRIAKWFGFGKTQE